MQFTPDRPPLRFVSPPGWPQPSETWTARNQGWQPPDGWTPPVPARVPAAPRHWRFWQPDLRHWDAFREPFADGITRAIVWGAVLLGLGLAGAVAWLFVRSETSSSGVPGLLFIVIGGIRLATGIAAQRSVDGRIRQAIATAAPVVRRDVDTWAYRAYLDSTAWERSTSGRPPIHFDEFQFREDAAGWGAPTGYAPLPMRWTARPPVRKQSSLRRHRTILIVLGVVVALFVAFVAFATISAWLSLGG